MAKDTEKLIRQLSLISYLMAERRPVTALEIRRDVEGYSGMNEDAFARRFYADRAELESLGHPAHRRPADRRRRRAGELLAAAGELPPPRDRVLRRRARRAAAPRCRLLDGEFAYAEPLRLALQQISWGRPSPLQRPTSGRRARHHRVAPAATTSRSAWRRSRRRSSATRRSPSTTTRCSATRSTPARSTRTTCSSRAASSTSSAARTSATRCASSASSRIRGKVAYATKAEHDFKRPTDFDPRAYASRAGWQFGDAGRHRRDLGLRAHRLAGRAPLRPLRRGRARPTTARSSSRPTYADARQLASFVLGLARARAGRSARPSWPTRSPTRVELLAERHTDGPELAPPAPPRAADEDDAAPSRNGAPPKRETAIRPERFARLVTLAAILIEAGRARREPARGRGPRAPADLRRRAARGHQRPQRRHLRRRHVRALRRGPRRRDDRGRPRAVRRQLRAPRAAAARRGEGARRRDRPHRRAPARGRADVPRARRSSPRSAARTRASSCTSPTATADDPDIARADLAWRSTSAALLRLEYYKEPTRTSSPSASSSRTRSSTGARAGTSPSFDPRARTTSATSAWTASRPPR